MPRPLSAALTPGVIRKQKLAKQALHLHHHHYSCAARAWLAASPASGVPGDIPVPRKASPLADQQRKLTALYPVVY